MGNKSVFLRIFLSLIFLFLYFSVLAGVENQVRKENNELIFSVLPVRPDIEYMYLFFRVKGTDAFQIRILKRNQTGRYESRINIDNVYGSILEFGFSDNPGQLPEHVKEFGPFKKGTFGKIILQKSEAVYPSPPGEPLFKLNLSSDNSQRIHSAGEAAEPEFTSSSNLRVFRESTEHNINVSVDLNFTFQNQVQEPNKKFSLSRQILKVERGPHRISAGDLMLNYAQYSAFGIVRRGLMYEFVSRSVYLGSFLANSQEKTGFSGMGIPARDGRLFGFVVGFLKNQRFNLRGMFLSGRDNLESATAFSSDPGFSRGEVFSLWGDLSLLKSALRLSGEYSSSNFGQADSFAGIEKKRNQAWKAGAAFVSGPVSANLEYYRVDRGYGSVANLFILDDQESYSGTLMLNFNRINFNLRYENRESDMGDPIMPGRHSRNLTGSLSVQAGSQIQFGAEFGFDNLEYSESEGFSASDSGMETLRYGVNCSLLFKNNSLSLRLGRSEAKNFTADLEATLGLNLRLGTYSGLNASLGYRETDNHLDNSESTLYNAFINGEVAFIPNLFTFTGGINWNRSESSSGYTATIIAAEAAANLYLNQLFKTSLTLVLSLKGRHQRTDSNGTVVDATLVFIQGNVAF